MIIIIPTFTHQSHLKHMYAKYLQFGEEKKREEKKNANEKIMKALN